MTVVQQHSHHTLKSMMFGYKPFSMPIDEEVSFNSGSSNILLNAQGNVEKRPGLSAVEGTPTTFSGNIKQVFTWRRWNSDFFIILNEVTATQSKVYKFRVGYDTSFSLIHTSSSPQVFRFVTSNNFLFFGNGNDMKKWDSVTVTNWGISVSQSASVTTGPNSAGAGANYLGGAYSPNWTNPGNVTASDNTYATCLLGPGDFADWLKSTNYGFAIPSTDTITGIKLEVEAVSTASGASFTSVFLLKAGVISGINLASSTEYPTVEGYTAFGGATELWGTTWTPADINNALFGAAVSARETAGGVKTVSQDHHRITVYTTRPNTPTTALSGTGITAVNGGFKYVYCYENSNTGHISSPTGSSAATGNFTNQQVDVTTTASTDTQVTGQRLFRTPDGGDGNFFGVSGNPYANTTGAKADTTADTALSTAVAPVSGFNDPPPNCNGFAYYANRIWMYVDNKVWFTGWEEINSGVAEECVPSGAAGNLWAFDSEVTGIAALENGVLVFTGGSIYVIRGDSLDTFARSTLAKGLGCRNQNAIARMGKVVAWLDSSSTIWITDGATLQEVSFDIRSDLNGIDHTQVSMCFYSGKTFRWLCVLDGGSGRLRIFDMDKELWMPPWTVGGQSIHSGETAVGTFDLLIGHSSKVLLKLNTAVFTDNAQNYSETLVWNLFPVVSDRAPDGVGALVHIGIETGATLPSAVKFVADDDPELATFTDITANVRTPQNRTQGTYVKENWYMVSGATAVAARRIAPRLEWSASSSQWKLYTMDIAYQVVGGRG